MKLATLTRSLLRSAAVAAFALALSGCASNPGANTADQTISDPLEVPNRFVFAVNEAADVLLIRPATEVYVGVAPDPVREAVHNFMQNLLGPLYIANNLLQGDFQGAQVSTGRFMTNTLLGLGGVLDVATVAGLPEQQEDFGQTLAVWGLGDGPYIVLPLIGPSNLRDTAGFAVDTVADPTRIWAYATDHKGLMVGRAGIVTIDRRSQLLKEIDDLRRSSLDYYATVRSLYAQQRAAAIRDGKPAPEPEFPTFDAPPKR